MISQKTADAIAAVANEWATKQGVSPVAVQDLLKRIGEVEGNKSFRDSLRLVVFAIEDEGGESDAP